MKTKPQGKLEDSFLGKILKLRIAVIASNWLFQGMRYMNIYEVSLKLLLDALLVVIISAMFSDKLTILSVLMAIIVAHTINWLINGHIFVLMRYVAPVPKTEKHFEKFISQMKASALKWKAIDGVAIYGSYCRGTLHKYSDLDVRAVTYPGVLNAISGSIFCFYQRLIAVFHVFPLDIYCCDKMEFLDQLRDDEIPHILIDHSGRLGQRYVKTNDDE